MLDKNFSTKKLWRPISSTKVIDNRNFQKHKVLPYGIFWYRQTRKKFVTPLFARIIFDTRNCKKGPLQFFRRQKRFDVLFNTCVSGCTKKLHPTIRQSFNFSETTEISLNNKRTPLLFFQQRNTVRQKTWTFSGDSLLWFTEGWTDEQHRFWLDRRWFHFTSIKFEKENFHFGKAVFFSFSGSGECHANFMK